MWFLRFGEDPRFDEKNGARVSRRVVRGPGRGGGRNKMKKKKKTKAALKRKVGARIETQFDPRYEAPAEVGSPRAHLTCVSSLLCSRRARTQRRSASIYLASREAEVGTRATERIDTDSPYPRYLRVAGSTSGEMPAFPQPREKESRRAIASRSLYEASNERVPKAEPCPSDENASCTRNARVFRFSINC
ncbi:Uncharacterized protein DBV15_10363, partial [Temnothorax longispinosus]